MFRMEKEKTQNSKCREIYSSSSSSYMRVKNPIVINATRPNAKGFVEVVPEVGESVGSKEAAFEAGIVSLHPEVGGHEQEPSQEMTPPKPRVASPEQREPQLH